MVNPFYVQPGGDYGPGLRGLADTVGEIGERKKEEVALDRAAAKTAQIRTAMTEAVKSRDADRMNMVAAKFPEVGQLMTKMGNYYSEETEKNQIDSLMAIYKDPSLENRERVATERLDFLRQKGVPEDRMTETLNFYDKYAGAPDDVVRQEVGMELATRLSPDQWKNIQSAMGKGDPGKTPTTAMGQFIKNNPDATPEELIVFTQKLKAVDTKTTGKTYSKKNPDGSVRTIPNVKPGSDQETQLVKNGFVEGTQTVGAKESPQERREGRTRLNTGKLSAMANEDPNKFYENQNYRQNDDGSLYLDPVTDLPVKLMPFFKATGKRGNIKAMQGMGEQWDDAKELSELLSIPSVQENLSKANADGIWDKVSGKWSNTINKWMQDKGIGGNSNTATAIARIQKMASEERKLYMGTAVTDNEMKSALAWMPSAGDSYESMVNKTELMGKEAEQAFRRWIDIFSKDADMSPFYKAFGIKRFNGEQEETKPETGKIKFLGFE